MDFVILFADDDRVYARNGWTRAGNRCTWVKIHEHATAGAGQGGADRGADGEGDRAAGLARG